MASLKSQFSVLGDMSVADEQCIVCGASTTFCCSRCRRVFYCSQSCQRVDWRSHKLTCTESTPTPTSKPPVIPSSALPEPSISLEAQVPLYERATEIFKQSLMSRFGSIIGAYEWFDANTNGSLDYNEFEKTLQSGGVSKTGAVKMMFSVLDRGGKGRIILSEFLADAARKLHPRPLDPTPTSQAVEQPLSVPPVLRPSDPATLPPGRRALRAASILAFRNGRYDDAMVSALQALGITSAAPRWAASVSKHPDNLVEVLLLCRIFIASKQLSRGEPFLRLLEDIFPSTVSPDPIYPSHVMATLLSCVGEVMDQYNRPDKAGEYFDEYLRISEKHFSAQSVVYGDALTIVCGFNLRRNKFDLALVQASEALGIRKSSLKAPHARLADAYNNRGIVLKALGKKDEAVSDLKECAQQRVKLFGASSIPVGDVFYALGTMLDTVEGEKYLNACHSIRLKILGPSHADSVAVANALKQYRRSHKENNEPVEVQKVEPPVEAAPPVLRPVMSKSGSKPFSPTDDRMVKIQSSSRELSPVDTSSFRHPSLKPMTITREQDKLEPPRTDGLEAKPLNVKESIVLSPESPGGKSLRKSVSAVILSSEEPSPRPARPNSSMWATSPPVSPSNQLMLPESPFKQNEDLVGTSEFREHLLSLDPYMIGTCDFSIQAALPKKVSAFWIPIAMKAIYAKRVIMEEVGPESDGARIEDFLISLKESETEVRLVFHLLNSVSENLKNQALKRSTSSFGKPRPSLSTSNFVAFLTSRTQNIALMEYFTKLLRQKHEETYQAVIKSLAGVKSISGVKAYLSKLETVKKSITNVDEDLSKLPKTAAGPSDAGQVVQQTLDMMADIQNARKTIVSRSKNISASMELLSDLFGMKRPLDEIDDAIKGLETLYDLLVQHANDGDESNKESEEGEHSEDRSGEESAEDEPEEEESEVSESHDSEDQEESELSNR